MLRHPYETTIFKRHLQLNNNDKNRIIVELKRKEIKLLAVSLKRCSFGYHLPSVL